MGTILMPELTLSNLLILLFISTVFIGLLILLHMMLNQKIGKKRTELSNKAECQKILNAHRKRLYTDYFWSNHMRFAWIMLFLLFFIISGIIINTIFTLILSLLLTIATVYFIMFAIKSYKAFPQKAAQALKKFEEEVEAAVKAEISFDADNIQLFSSRDEAFHTEPEIFSFPTQVTKIQFPPYETQPAKQPIIATRKLEFLILSREYFSICKNAATFNLLNPNRAPIAKKCVELPGTAGECQEYYYSQIRNVFYDDKDESIHIIYNHSELEDIKFPCKKNAPNRKPAMKALKGKLRLTERQRLHKIDEHEKFEEILERRAKKNGIQDIKPEK